MTLEMRLQALIDALPESAAVTLTKDALKALLAAEEGQENPESFAADLTVKQVAKEFGLSANAVRRWLETGELRGYKLHGREWRITVAALRDFQDHQREGRSRAAPDTGPVDLGAWRKLRRRDA